MKKIILGLVALTSITAANAQSGTVLVGGNVDFNSYTTNYDADGADDDKSHSFEIAPTIGYQFNDNWTAGVVGSFGTSKNRVPMSAFSGVEGLSGTVFENDIKSTSFGVGPFVRYTQPLSEVFALFGQLQGTYQSQEFKDDGEVIDELHETGFEVGFFPAVFINVKNGFGLNFNIGGIGYSSMKVGEDEDKYNNFNVTFGKSLSIGISKNF